MNPLQAAPASDKHQDNQMEGTGAANDQCHLVIIETITFTFVKLCASGRNNFQHWSVHAGSPE